jgi:thymidylate synthase (FAD)
MKPIKFNSNEYKHKYNNFDMQIKLISYSQPPSKTTTSLQDTIAYCARVSNPTNQHNTETNERLLKYLIKNQHWSPFEMVSICIEIETTRDIARQILRHRSFSFQEFSQRYAVASLGFETREARLQDTRNRQNSIAANDDNLESEWTKKQQELAALSQQTYTWALENGIAKEQARAVLPEGMTTTRMYMNGTLRSWIHYIQLRSANGTQKEHREVAIECARVISELFPMILTLIE